MRHIALIIWYKTKTSKLNKCRIWSSIERLNKTKPNPVRSLDKIGISLRFAVFKINDINLIITVATHKPFLFVQQIPPEGSHRIKIRSNNYLSIIKSSFIASDFLKAYSWSIDKKIIKNSERLFWKRDSRLTIIITMLKAIPIQTL